MLVHRTPGADQALLADLQFQVVGESDLALALSDRPVPQMRTDIVKARGGLHVVLLAEDVARGVRNARALAAGVARPVQSADLQAEVEQPYRVRVLRKREWRLETEFI